MILDKIGYISKDSLVYKTSSNRLLQESKASYEENKKTYPIDMEINVAIGENLD